MKNRANLLINKCLMASFMYYIHDISFVTDEVYDSWALELRDCIESSTCPYKNIINKLSFMSSTSLYYIKEDEYPNSLKHTAWQLYLKREEFQL